MANQPPLRSPVLGYNHNVRHRGRVFHVQTEDSGPSHPRLYTHLFYAGTILASKKHEYDATSPEDVVRLFMQRMHKAMMKELTQGTHDDRITSFFAARGEPPALDDGSGGGSVQTQAPPKGSAAVAVAAAAAAEHAPRPVVASGSIDVAAARPPTPVTTHPVVVQPQGPVPQHAAPLPQTQPHVSAQPQAARPIVVVKPGEVRRPPVVLSSSADGVVVQRNVVIGVGGAAPPLNGAATRAARPRPAVPYVVREGSYQLSDRTPAERAVAATTAPTRTRTPMAPSDRTPGERAAFGSELVSDKSLDEVILEYLSDDAETE
jgi:hypothetical protein